MFNRRTKNYFNIFNYRNDYYFCIRRWISWFSYWIWQGTSWRLISFYAKWIL